MHWDDSKGGYLDPKLVRKARMEEIAELHKYKVYEKRPIAECIAVTGKKPMGSRWVDTNKGEPRVSLEDRRKGFKKKRDPNMPAMDTFAPMPARHAQVIAKELNLEGGKSVTSPIVKYDVHNDGELKGADVKIFRSLTMRGAYLAMDRYDIQHATKELATEMQTPTNEGVVRLKRLARYLNGALRLVQKFKRQSEHRWVSRARLT